MEDDLVQPDDFWITALVFVAMIFSVVFLGFRFATAESMTTDKFPVTGNLWSANIGWTLFNEHAGGVEFNTDAEGYLHGWGWSDNIGWLKFDRSLTGVRGAGNNYGARFDRVNGTLSGWTRYCAGTIGGDCLSASRTDGWDGWLKFMDVPLATTTQNSHVITTADGWAWGGPVVGWTKVFLQTAGELPACDPENEDCTPPSSSVGCYIIAATTEIQPLSEYGFSWGATSQPDVCESEDFDIREGELSGIWQEEWPALGEQAEKTYRIICHEGSSSGSCSVTFTEATDPLPDGLVADLFFNTLTSKRQVAASYGERQGSANPVGPFTVRLGSNLRFVWRSTGANSCLVTSDVFTTTDQSANGLVEHTISEDVDIEVHLECRDENLHTVEDDLLIQVTDPTFREF